MRSAAAALLLVLGGTLGGCGIAGIGGGGADPAPSATTPPVDPNAVPTTPAPTGEPAPAALSAFRCVSDGTGTYTANGTLANDTKARVTFQVTVQVGPVDTPTQSAVTKQVPKVAGGGSVPFEITKIPVVEGGTCHVRVDTIK